ncbi:MAG: Hdr-like menaquinol oxidoreductase iron-sulfur subunit 1 precursor [Methanosaeta sp. PtaB.Bin039]|nr:MAG: Hdr-like menaquinol oxidoreductase iron-sulfur subunit 1 precursor [Methanosaeta sp. PtaB.Bin039]HOT05966.1 4Fe-4S dicluster domain-containing protein [Methanotrichaceae archaeon]HQF16830.1 4Fe-4S dicluster domain-containing protein [Methanotrichaceae archaeon]HQI90156.1 4Fe-4S dicluster domain-containing protein [Methanotrichaceae archaeon]HQJ29122.1 4Fe-4S dicluster domain-containing protein [Methanotrichaceae archaeon]
MPEIFVRLDRCVGCRSCEMACATEHSAGKSLISAASEHPRPRKRLYVEMAEGTKLPMVCRHCEDAPCASVCRTGAMTQDPETHIVTRDAEKCIGCWMCAMVCPYGVVGRTAEGRVALKCDRCPDLDVPACVAACPTHTLVFMEAEDFSELLRVDAAARLARGYRSRA